MTSKTKTNRYLIKSKHEQALAPGWTYGWDVRDASDNNYPNDFQRTWRRPPSASCCASCVPITAPRTGA